MHSAGSRERPLAVFRFDASREIGGGHAARCITFARALEQVGWQCCFAARGGTAEILGGMSRLGDRWISLAGDKLSEAGQIGAVLLDGCDLLVVDHYELGAAFETRCRAWAKTIMVVDDLANRPHDCDVLLDPTHGRPSSDYGPWVSESCRLMMGARFALLRPEFAYLRQATLGCREENRDVARILVSLGATDPDNMVSTVLDGIARAQIDAGIALDVVMGAKAPNLSVVRNLTNDLPMRATVHVGVKDMERLIARADLAIGAAGTSAWERCCLGLPSLLLVLADNQRVVARELEREGAARIVSGENRATAAEIAAALTDICSSPDALLRMGRKAALVCDGLGTQRMIVDFLPPETAQDGKLISLRLGTMGDCADILDWQTDERTRRYARNPNAPDPQEHANWLRTYLNSAEGILCIIVCDGEAAGILRFDRVSDGTGFEVSVLIAPAKYKMGIGLCALKLGRRLFPDDEVHAEVLPGNEASHALFRQAGYKPETAGWYISKPEWERDLNAG